MATSNYCVTFRIANKTINGQSYDDRRQRLIDNVTAQKRGFWAEPTSLLLVESDLNTTSFGKAAVQGLSSRDDLVFVFDPSDMSAGYFGPVQHLDVLRSFFPKAKKID
jgi:hypothetical protein